MNKKFDIKNMDQQLADWKKQFNKEIPERVGLAFYTNDDGEVEIEVYMTDESMWMSQQIMAQLFGVEEHTITYHIQEIYKSEELEENSTTRKIRVVQQEGKRQVNREIQFYNLDMVISVGYRVNSIKATQLESLPHECFMNISRRAMSSTMTDLNKGESLMMGILRKCLRELGIFA